MSNKQEMSHSNWRQMEFKWQQAQDGWHDDTTRYFKNRFMDPLDYGMRNYLRVLDDLMETLREAQEVSKRR